MFVSHLRPPNSTYFPYTTLFRSQMITVSGCAPHCHSDHRTRLDHYLQLFCVVSEVRSSCLHGGIGLKPSVLNIESPDPRQDRKSTRLNSSHTVISYAVFCLKKKT